jgi:hypothetical protein
VTFAKVHFDREYPASLQYRRPVIVVNQVGASAADSQILSVNWSPQFEAPLHIDPNEAALFYQAYRCDECVRSCTSCWQVAFSHVYCCYCRTMSQYMSEAPLLKLRLNEVC